MTDSLHRGGVDLLRAASTAAQRRGNRLASAYLERAAQDHINNGGCPCAPLPCAYEQEAAQLLADAA